MFQLSAKANKDEYTTHMGTDVLLGKKVVRVVKYSKDGRSGTYERGFKFTTNVYGGLFDAKANKVTFDHGVTWVWCYQSNVDNYNGLYTQWKLTPKGRIRLESDSQKEFSYDAIQAINRQFNS